MTIEKFPQNINKLDDGVFRTVNGNADEMIAVGRIMKAGFNCSRVDLSNSRYDAVIDIDGILLRAQIKGTNQKNISLTGGGRSGKQIDKSVAQKTYKYTKNDCDVLIGIISSTAELYIIPIQALDSMPATSVSLDKIKQYRENWKVLYDIAKDYKK